MYKAGCQVLVVHGAGSGEHADKQIRRCRASIVGFAAARPPSMRVPAKWSSTGKEDKGAVWSEGSRGGYGEGEW